MTADERLPESQVLALATAAARSLDLPVLNLYLLMAEHQGYSPRRIYSLARAGVPGLPIDYETFQDGIAMAEERISRRSPQILPEGRHRGAGD
jgi:hypothetical protein